jgi:hypothetical protein
VTRTQIRRDFLIVTVACAPKPARDVLPLSPTRGRILARFRAHRGRSRRVTGAPQRPRFGQLFSVTPRGSPAKPARDIRTRPASSARPPGAPPGARSRGRAVVLRIASSTPPRLLAPSRKPTPRPTRLLPRTRRHRRREPLPALRASRLLRHGTSVTGACPDKLDRFSAPLPDRRGSTKRRAGNHRGAGVGHESAARWISPRPTLK